jgi:hypothetical protein
MRVLPSLHSILVGSTHLVSLGSHLAGRLRFISDLHTGAKISHSQARSMKTATSRMRAFLLVEGPTSSATAAQLVSVWSAWASCCQLHGVSQEAARRSPRGASRDYSAAIPIPDTRLGIRQFPQAGEVAMSIVGRVAGSICSPRDVLG